METEGRGVESEAVAAWATHGACGELAVSDGCHRRRLFGGRSTGPRNSSIHSRTVLPANSSLAMPMTLRMCATSPR